MSEYDYTVEFLKGRLKELCFFVTSNKIFQYYSAKMEEKFGPDISVEQAKKYIAQLESAIKRLKGEE